MFCKTGSRLISDSKEGLAFQGKCQQTLNIPVAYIRQCLTRQKYQLTKTSMLFIRISFENLLINWQRLSLSSAQAKQNSEKSNM